MKLKSLCMVFIAGTLICPATTVNSMSFFNKAHEAINKYLPTATQITGLAAAVGNLAYHGYKTYKQYTAPEQHAVCQTDPYKAISASVRQGNELGHQEQAFCIARKTLANEAIKKLINAPLNKPTPTIAIVCSGGGYRAMLYTLGALVGAQETGILDATTYMVGASGSTWAMNGWLSNGKSIHEYRDWLVNNIHFGLKRLNSIDIQLIADHLSHRFSSENKLDFVDLYGSLLANELFYEKGAQKQRMTLSSQMYAISNAQVPLPIYTAVSGETPYSEQLWYEFTPYEVGAAWKGSGMYVPSWAFGRKFNQGVSINFAPEQNLGVLMATFGLAPGITVRRLFDEVGLLNKLPFPQELSSKRIATADFHNFSYGMQQSPFCNYPIIKLIDAGIHLNLPYPPISGQRPERKADIIIFLDSSVNNFAQELRNVEQYARFHKLQFPFIDYTKVGKETVSVFKDEQNPQAPIVIYVPRILEKRVLEQYKNDPGFGHLYQTLVIFDVERFVSSGAGTTFNFSYSPEEARAMCALGEFNMKAAKQAIAQAIRSYSIG